MNKGLLVIVSGFSGAGKGTLTRALIRDYDCYALSVSATTREPRQGEAHGRDYFFLTTEEFENLIREDALLEYASYVNHYYGTPRAYVEQMLSMGMDVILEIDVQGAMQVKERFPEAITVFVSTPGARELKQRLIGRGTETMTVISDRLARAKEEAGLMDRYDYLLVNDVLEESIPALHHLIRSAHCRMGANRSFIEYIKNDFDNI